MIVVPLFRLNQFHQLELYIQYCGQSPYARLGHCLANLVLITILCRCFEVGELFMLQLDAFIEFLVEDRSRREARRSTVWRVSVAHPKKVSPVCKRH